MSRPPARLVLPIAMLVLSWALTSCATPSPSPGGEPPGSTIAYSADAGDTLLDRFAPIFVIPDAHEPWNRIGTPSARLDEDGDEHVYVDPDIATVYRRSLSFEAQGQPYTNLIYRVHFERSPFTWIPFNAGAGRNVGLFVVITLDAHERPVWVTTVQTCGCYHAILPTNFLPEAAWPEGWDAEGVTVYGEQLPGQLRWPARVGAGRLVVTVRGGSHRVMDLVVLDEEHVTVATVPARVRPIADLDALALSEGTTSFFHESGRKRGLVKGAWKPLETLLFGLWIRDFHVGRDRRYGPRDETQLFYTTLNPARKERSDMWQFARFLELEGWKTGIVAPPSEALGAADQESPGVAGAEGRGSRM